MAAKWFDLLDYDSKLERLTVAPGHHTLRLELPHVRLPEPEQGISVSDMLLDMGWTVESMGDDRLIIENHQPLNTASQIVAAIRSFYSESEVTSAHKPMTDMRQGERMDGIQPQARVSRVELDTSISGVEKSDLERIRSSVEKAQRNVEERLSREASVIFDGKGLRLAEHLTDSVMSRTGWAETDAAFFTFDLMARAADRPNSGETARLNQLARALGGDNDADLRSAEDWLLSPVLEGNGAIADALEAIRNRSFYKYVEKRVEHAHIGELIRPRDVVAHIFVSGTENLSANAMSGQAVGREETFEGEANRLPFRVLRDNSVATRALLQNMKSVNKALDFISKEMGVERNNLFPGQSSIPARFSFDAVSANEGAAGMVRSLTEKARSEDDDESEDVTRAMVLSLSVKKGGTFVHELGHLVHGGNRLTDEEVHSVLRDSGVLAQSMQVLDALYPDGGERYDYLSSEAEIFARSFEAHFVNLVRADGDIGLDAIGGIQTTYIADVAAPHGDLETSTRFMDLLKSTLEAKKDAQHSATVKPQARPAAEAHSGVAP